MEEQNEVIKPKESGNYLLGTIGAILGGIIGAIPWTLVYFFANYNIALLAILVGMGAIKGYTIFKGKFTKKTKILISIISLIILVSVELIVLPLIYTVAYSVDLKAFYTEMRAGIIHDLIFIILFGIIGIAYSISKISTILAKQELEKNKNGEKVTAEELRETEINNSLANETKKDLEVLRRVFEKLNAQDKKTAVEKQLILEELEKENVEKPEKLFKNYKRLDIIRKSKGKFYYSKNSEVFATKSYWGWFIVIIIIISLTNAMNNIDNDTDYDNSSNTNTIVSNQTETIYDFGGQNITVTLPKGYSISVQEGLHMFENESAYGIIFVYSKSELAEGLTLADCPPSIEEYIYGIYPVEEQKNMEAYNGLNKNAYKLSFDTLEGIYKIKVNSYIVETENYIVEMHGVSEANEASKNEVEFENMLNSVVEKTN